MPRRQRDSNTAQSTMTLKPLTRSTGSDNSFIPWALGFIACLVSTLFVIYIDQSETRRHQQLLRSETIESLSSLRTEIEGRINSNLRLFTGLAVRLSLDPEMNENSLNEMTRELMKERDLVRSVGISKGYINQYVYP